jgi:hypothetical protein
MKMSSRRLICDSIGFMALLCLLFLVQACSYIHDKLDRRRHLLRPTCNPLELMRICRVPYPSDTLEQVLIACLVQVVGYGAPYMQTQTESHQRYGFRNLAMASRWRKHDGHGVTTQLNRSIHSFIH